MTGLPEGFGSLFRVTEARQKDEAQVETLTREIDATEGRKSFETLQGFTIVGDEPVEAVVSRFGRLKDSDIFLENGAFQVRGPRDDAPRSIAIRLKSGNWIDSSILPGFIGAILIKDGAASSLSYAPAADGRFGSGVDKSYGAEIGRWTALMHQGRYASRDDLRRSALVLRRYKHSNPSLGILAAYAYERTGDTDDIDRIAGYFVDYDQPVPFDVAMLGAGNIRKNVNGTLETETVLPDRQRKLAPVGGSFPLLTRGWSLLDLETQAISPRLFDLRPRLVISLWTTFSPEGGSQIAELLRTGEL